YNVTVGLQLAANCRLWIEDIYTNRIAGDGKGQYGACSESLRDDSAYNQIEFPDQEYYVVTKVEASFRKEKKRGPFNGNVCLCISGTVDIFSFDTVDCGQLFTDQACTG
ncbi:14997_t:CDS:1, partial [Racocetra fulgida]